MSTTQKWTAGAVALAVLLAVASWFLLIGPQRSAASDLRAQADQQQQQNDSIRLRTAQLKAQYATLPQREGELAKIKQQLPDNPALPALIRELSKQADASGVALSSVTPSAPTAYGATGAVTTTSSEAAPMQSIQTGIVVDGSFAQLTLFLQKLQRNVQRAYLVENIQLTPKADDGSSNQVEMTLSGKIFELTSAQTTVSTTAGTAGGTGTTGTTPSPSASSTPGGSTLPAPTASATTNS